MSKSEQKEVFKRFVRFHRNQDGTGIGLSIAKNIIKTHHSELNVTSRRGEGSTFSFKLFKKEFK